MSVAYQQAQKQRYRITLDLSVFGDFDPHQIDWEKLFKLEGAEKCDAYVEDLSKPDRWWSLSEEIAHLQSVLVVWGAHFTAPLTFKTYQMITDNYIYQLYSFVYGLIDLADQDFIRNVKCEWYEFLIGSDVFLDDIHLCVAANAYARQVLGVWYPNSFPTN